MSTTTTRQSGQRTFNPIDFSFRWTDDGSWYEWDRTAAHKTALAARNKEATRLRKAGFQVSCFSLPNQFMSKGGIGSGQAHIEAVVNVYGVNWD